MDTCQQESLRAPGSGTKPNPPTTPRLYDQHNLKGGQEMEDRGSGGSNRDATGSGPPPPQGILEPNKGVVKGCGQPHAAARSVHPRVDNGGASLPVIEYRTVMRNKSSE